jgi:predicted nucleic acid-binding protein
VIVIDASALAKFVLKEGNWERFYEVLPTEVISVDHMVKEVANAIGDTTLYTKACSHGVALKRFQLLRKIIDEALMLLESELKYLPYEYFYNMKVRVHMVKSQKQSL